MSWKTPNAAASDMSSINSLVTMLNTRAQLGNTVAANGVVGPISLTGTADEDLPPPSTAQPATGGSYNGYVEITGFTEISSSGELSIVGGEIVVSNDGAGDYRTPHAWLDIGMSTNNAVIGFIFGIKKASDGLIRFSQRVTGDRASEQDQRTNVSGGGFIPNLEPGDTISVWAASSLTGDLTIYDANLGLEMAVPAALKV